MRDTYIKQFHYYQSLAEDAIKQVEKAAIFDIPEEHSNSIAIIMKHMSGNMLSRWTDIFTTDGEKAWRNRDDEFTVEGMSPDDVFSYWEIGWAKLFETLENLEDSDLDKTIYIRNMGHTVHEAIVRQAFHYSYHVGQIVFLSKLLKGKSFKSLSIPKGESVTYNQDKFNKPKSRKHFTEDL